jgi:putative ABC transport system permease protein
MRWHHRLYVMVRCWFASGALDRELDEELQFHFDREVQVNLERGLSPAQARRAAALAVGNPQPVMELSRDGRSGAWARQFARDLGYGVRLLRKSPGFSCAAITIIALGVGAVTAIFSVVYGVALTPLPFHEPDRLVSIWTMSANTGQAKLPTNGADHRDWKAANHVFEDIALYRTLNNFNLTGAGEPERLLGSRISSNLLPVLGITPAIGRGFTEQEDDIGHELVVLLSDGLWRRRFNADQSIVGQTISLNGIPHTVVGVMGRDFQYPSREYQIWTPLTINPAEMTRQVRGSNSLAVARLKRGVTVEEAQTELSAIAARMFAADPQNPLPGVLVVPMHADLLANVRTALSVMLGAVLCLLLVAALNLSTLVSARAASRGRELGVRLALGATRGRVVMQTATEIVPLLVVGGALGVGLAAYAISVFIPLAPVTLPRVESIRVSTEVLCASIVILSVTGLIAALLPALQVWNANVTAATREESRSATVSPRQARARNVLVVTQIALAVPLLVAGVLLTRTFTALNAQSPGFESANALTAHLAIPRSKYRGDAAIAAVVDRIIERVAAIPGVTSAGMVNRLPLAGGTSMAPFEFDAPRALHPDLSVIDMRMATVDYFRAIGIPVLEGRAFEARDTAQSAPVGIIDERIARLMWPGESAIGKRFRVPPHLRKMPWFEIVGVVGHIRHDALDVDARAQVYFSATQMPQDRMALVVRADRNVAALAASVVRAIHEIDPEQPVYELRTMDEVVDRSLGQRWMNMTLVVTFAVVSLLLCAVGVYGVIAFGVARQRREFGIRLALGATPATITRGVVRRGIVLAMIGVAIGTAIAAAVARGMESLLFGVRSTDLASFGAAIFTLLAIAFVASALPARRAAAVDPALVLRSD